jgi:hypothetical protein
MFRELSTVLKIEMAGNGLKRPENNKERQRFFQKIVIPLRGTWIFPAVSGLFAVSIS